MICALALMALTSIAHAQWKWRDADGRTQYSDRPPPPSVAEKDILQRPNSNAVRVAPSSAQAAAQGASAAASASSAPAAPARPASEPSSRDKLEKERKAQEDKARAEVNVENCRQAQNSMRILESGVRVRTRGENGDTQPMTEQMRQEQIRQAQAVITASCK
ncbi:hypothetical protein CDL60_10655 [Roseateles noduli]|nr:hypothetical protein CDL60_10655 [Roseateles noduli]